MLMRFLLRIAALGAAALAGSTLDTSPALAAKAYAPSRFTVSIEGSGPDLILIPGLVSSRQVWDRAVAGLGGRYRVHRLQLSGFAGEPVRGNAQGPVLQGVVEELQSYISAKKLRRPMVVGHSIGGLMTLMLAARHPGSVGKALIVDALPFYGMMFTPAATADGAKPQAEAFRKALLGMSRQAYDAQQTQALASLVKTESERPKLVGDALASDRTVAANAVYEAMITDMRPDLPALKTPLTIAYAVNSFATEERFGALFRQGYAAAPHVRFEPVAETYHFIMLDQPIRFQQILQRFLEKDSTSNFLRAGGHAKWIR